MDSVSDGLSFKKKIFQIGPLTAEIVFYVNYVILAVSAHI